MEKKLSIEILKNFVSPGDRIVVGVSGGADSMCLLSLLMEFKEICDFFFVCHHVNHGLRGAESDRDENFVRKFCELNGIVFSCERVDVSGFKNASSKTVEQAARELRYDSFEKVREKLSLNKIFVAHNKDDQAETILMHIFRGSSLKGARGMSERGKTIYRPLLAVSRAQIERYNREHNVEHIEDSSNVDINFSRNFIRHEIMERLKNVYPNISSALLDFSRRCAADEEFIASCLPLELMRVSKNCVTLFSEVKDLPLSLSLRLISLAFEKLGVYCDIEEGHLKAVCELFSKRTGAKYFVNRVYAIKEYEGVTLYIEKPISNQNEIKLKEGKIELAGFGEVFVEFVKREEKVVFDKNIHYLDADLIPQNAVFRTKREGDVFAKLGSGSKKLSGYLKDKKVPQRLRDNIYVLAAGSEVLCVCNMDVSEKAKVSDSTKSFVKITYTKTKPVA